MNKILFSIVLTMLAASTPADPLARGRPAPAEPVIQIDPSLPYSPLGIEGTGDPLLGIEGTGIIQRTDNGEFVLNDSLYTIGPGVVRVTIDAQSATLAAVRPGHVVLAGARPPKQAGAPMLALVELDNLIRGPIDANGVDVAGNTVTVLGQELVLPNFVELADDNGDLGIEDLLDGDYLKISGLVDSDGEVVATRIERSLPVGDTLEISGRVDSLNAATGLLRIGKLTIDFSAAQFVFMIDTDLSIGSRLEIVGNSVSTGGVLSAVRIRPLVLPLSAADHQSAEVQGFVDQAIIANEFVLSGQIISVSAATVYERGDAVDVVPGRLVEVEGVFDVDGSLVADKVSFEEEALESEIRINAVVESVDANAQEFGLLGLTIRASVATRYEDKSGSSTPFLTFADLEPGAFVEVRGFDDPDGSDMVGATRITRDIEDDSSLKARVSANDGLAISVLGLAVLTDAATQYEDADGNDIEEAQFIALAQVGVLVRATGDPVPGGIDASKLSIE